MRVCPETIEEIVTALRQSRENDFYFRCLYERSFSKTRLFFLRKNLSPDDALELTQEVFFSVYKNLESLRQAADFEAWLYRIARNIFRNHLEKNRAGKRSVILVKSVNDDGEDFLQDIAADIMSPLEGLLETERRNHFRRAMQELPEQMRRVFYLKIVREMTNPEIAAALGISINTVKAHVFQARQKLRSRLAESTEQ